METLAQDQSIEALQEQKAELKKQLNDVQAEFVAQKESDLGYKKSAQKLKTVSEQVKSISKQIAQLLPSPPKGEKREWNY